MAKFILEALPYAKNALEPHISERTLDFHYGKHHQTYVDNLNKLIENTDFENLALEEIVKTSERGIFNNAAQVWNHTFYWNCLTPNHKSEPTGNLMDAIVRDFGTFADFKAEFSKQATGLFGSGWLWLVKNSDNKLEIVAKTNAGNPLTDGKSPILVIDVWEHAYYLDKQNARAKYIDAYWEIVNWEFAEKNFEK